MIDDMDDLRTLAELIIGLVLMAGLAIAIAAWLPSTTPG